MVQALLGVEGGMVEALLAQWMAEWWNGGMVEWAASTVLGFSILLFTFSFSYAPASQLSHQSS